MDYFNNENIINGKCTTILTRKVTFKQFLYHFYGRGILKIYFINNPKGCPKNAAT